MNLKLRAEKSLPPHSFRSEITIKIFALLVAINT
jgi:hypothetical protein